MSTTFPRSIEGFATYLATAVPYLTTHKVRLGVSIPHLTQLDTYYGDNVTVDTYLYNLLKWQDDGGGRTKNIIDRLVNKQNQIKKLLSVIYNDIPVEVWNEDDRNAFNRKTGLPVIHTKPTAPIAEECYVKAKALGGGDVMLECSSLEDSSRPSKPAGAVAVEIAHRIVKPKLETDGAGNDLAGKPRFEQLAQADDGTAKTIHNKAKFTDRLGTQNSGNYLLFYARWINTKYPGLEGHWTGPYSLLIS